MAKLCHIPGTLFAILTYFEAVYELFDNYGQPEISFTCAHIGSLHRNIHYKTKYGNVMMKDHFGNWKTNSRVTKSHFQLTISSTVSQIDTK